METKIFTKFTAEFFGTLVLVLMGCGSAVIAGANGTSGVGLLGIAFAFGLSVVAMAYAIGHISGCHINPAISIGMVVAGRMKASEAAIYIVAQILGAIAGAGLLFLIASGKDGYMVTGAEWLWRSIAGRLQLNVGFCGRNYIYLHIPVRDIWRNLYKKYSRGLCRPFNRFKFSADTYCRHTNYRRLGKPCTQHRPGIIGRRNSD